MKNVIYILLLSSITLHAQTDLSIQYGTNQNITASVTTNQEIGNTNFRLGIILEAIPRIDTYGTYITFDYPIYTLVQNLETDLGVEAGFMFVNTDHNQVNKILGLNGSLTYWFNNIGITTRLNYKSSNHIDQWNATIYGGLKYRILN